MGRRIPKVTKKTAQYQEVPRGQMQCYKCVMYHAKDKDRGTCDMVYGQVSANGYCKYFKRDVEAG